MTANLALVYILRDLYNGLSVTGKIVTDKDDNILYAL